MRGDVRRMLAQRSRELLARYLRGESAPEGCPLSKMLVNLPSTLTQTPARSEKHIGLLRTGMRDLPIDGAFNPKTPGLLVGCFDRC
jgi:hypothetical protein